MNFLKIFSHNHPAYPIHITINVIMSTFLAILAAVGTIIADISIRGDLGLSYTQSIWITTLYLLGVNTIVPTGNWFANRFGYHRMYAFGIVLFTLATLLAAVSSDFASIAIARFLEGAGAGFIFPIGLALIVKNIPKEKVILGINIYIGIAFGLGLSFGIFYAGWLAQFHSWRGIFFTIVPFGMLAMISCWLSRKTVPPKSTHSFDYFGFITFALFISCLLIALTLGPIRATNEGWGTPYIQALFGTSILSLILCVIIESKHPAPLFPLTLFKDPLFSVSLMAMFLIGMGIFAGLSVSVDYMLNGLFYEKYTVGKITAIYGITIGAFSILSSYLGKIIPLPVLTLSGLFLLIVSYFANNELSWLTGYSEVIPILLMRGMGIGLALGPTTAMALSQIPKELQTSAATVLTFFRQVGGTYGGTLISIFSIRRTIFHTARFAEEVNPHLPAYKQTMKSLTSKFPNGADAKAAIVKNIETQAYIQGLNDALIIFGYVTTFFTAILFLLIVHRVIKSRKAKTNP